jgi:hypothetical protein
MIGLLTLAAAAISISQTCPLLLHALLARHGHSCAGPDGVLAMLLLSWSSGCCCELALIWLLHLSVYPCPVSSNLVCPAPECSQLHLKGMQVSQQGQHRV